MRLTLPVERSGRVSVLVHKYAVACPANRVDLCWVFTAQRQGMAYRGFSGISSASARDVVGSAWASSLDDDVLLPESRGKLALKFL